MAYTVKCVNKVYPAERAPVTRAAAVSFLYDRRGHRKYLTASERRAFLAAARRMPSEIRAFCSTLAYTGARISEVLALTPEHFDQAARLVVFESLKKRRKGIFRAVPVPPELLRLIDGLCRVGANQPSVDRRIWAWSRTTAWTQVKTVMAAAGVSGPQASPKGLRHGFAVGALQAGVPINFIKKWLGHARLATTEIYTEAVGEEEQGIAARAWDAF
jgi:integrase/recombinase XerD